MSIPEEAVEAAAKAFYGTAWDDVSYDDLKYALDQMRETLDAAAPYMLAQARAQALLDAADWLEAVDRPPSTASERLRVYATQEASK